MAFGILGVVELMADWREYREGVRDLQVVDAPPLDPATVAPGPAYEGAVIERVEDAHLLRDDRVDVALAQTSTRVRLNQPAHDVPPELADVELTVLRHFRREGKLVFNADAVRLETDLGYDRLARCGPGEDLLVELRVAPFFSGLATNELGDKLVISRRSGQRWGGPSLAITRQGYVRELSQSWLANIIGISTVALTTDDHVLIVSQTRENVASGGKLAPSGSGSLDPADVAAGDDLSSVLVAGMERELREECNLAAGVRVATRVIGFARWLERGAKPEFFGVSRVGVKARDIDGRQVRQSERHYVSVVHAESLGRDAVAALRAGVSFSRTAAHSVPLTAALDSLGRALAADASLLDALL